MEGGGAVEVDDNDEVEEERPAEVASHFARSCPLVSRSTGRVCITAMMRRGSQPTCQNAECVPHAAAEGHIDLNSEITF
jgi:hypothetical protein